MFFHATFSSNQPITKYMTIKIAQNLYERTRSHLAGSEHVSTMDSNTLNKAENRCNDHFTDRQNGLPRFQSVAELKKHCVRLKNHNAAPRKIETAARDAVDAIGIGMLIIEGLSYFLSVEQFTATEQISMAKDLAISIYRQNDRLERAKREQTAEATPKKGSFSHSLGDTLDTMANTLIGLVEDDQYGPNGELLHAAK